MSNVVSGNSNMYNSSSESPYIDFRAEPSKILRIYDSYLREPYLETRQNTVSTEVTVLNEDLLDQGNTTKHRSQGISVSISDNASTTYICAGAPYPIIGNNYGGCVIYDSIDDDLFNLDNEYDYVQFTDDNHAGTYSDINEDGTFFVFSTGTGISENTAEANFYQNVAGVWTDKGQMGLFADVRAIKISDNYALVNANAEVVSIYKYDGVSAWALTSTLYNGAGAGFFSVSEICNGNKAMFFDSTSGLVKIYTRSVEVWTLIDSIASSGILQISAVDDIMVMCNANFLYIYEANVLVNTVPKPAANLVSCCTNGDVIFFASSTVIYSMYKILGKWFLSTTTTTPSISVYQMACNSNRLVIGNPTASTYGRVFTYELTPIGITQSIITNYVEMVDTTDLILGSNYGQVIIDEELQAPTISTDRLKLSTTNTVLLPGLIFGNDVSTGLYRPLQNQIGIAVNGTQTVKFDDVFTTVNNQLMLKEGSVSSPSVAFVSSNTGFYNGTGTSIAACVSGVDVFQINTGIVDFYKPLKHISQNNNVTAYTYQLYTQNNGATSTGSISTGTGTNLVFFSVSDRRLKKDIKHSEGSNEGLSIIEQLCPCEYTWKSNDRKSYGFIADELQKVLPNAVLGNPGDLDSDGNEIHQQIAVTEIIPYLTCAIKELSALVKSLNDRIYILENK